MGRRKDSSGGRRKGKERWNKEGSVGEEGKTKKGGKEKAGDG